MKQILSTSILLVFMVVVAMAQPLQGGQFSPEDMAKRQTEQMTEDLQLNEQQVEKVTALNTKYMENMQSTFQNAGGDREQMREKMEAFRTERNDELKKILTEEQFKKYQELENERMQQRRANRPPMN